MNLYKISIIIIVVILLFSCSSNVEEKKSIIDSGSLKITKKKFSKLTELGKISKAVKLEVSKHSLLGRINRILVDKKNGDLVIGDFRTTKQVLRFNKQGKFICKFGKIGQGPGEYVNLKNFTITNKGDIVLLTRFKLIKFSNKGIFLHEVRTNVFGGYIECIDDLIYVSVLRYDHKSVEKKAILVFDSSFSQVGRIGDYETRLEKYLFGVSGFLAKKDRSLYYIDFFDPCLNVYNTKTHELVHLPIPNNNSKLDKFWKKKYFTQKDDEKVLTILHRFDNIFIVGKKIFLSEVNYDKTLFQIWLLDLEKKETLIFNQSSLFGDYQLKIKQDLYFNSISGSYDKGIIGVVNNKDNFNLHKNKYLILKDIEFKAEDNPILIFFEFNR